jgi:uncharacterized membrane protein YeaQ/YmgE (transglycosylase-associated protein family)
MKILAFAPVAGHHILTWIVIGLVAGLVASILVRGRGLGFVRDVLAGLAGAVIGGIILHVVRGGPHTSPSVGWEIVVSVIGAVVLLLVVQATGHGRTRGGIRRRQRSWL